MCIHLYKLQCGTGASPTPVSSLEQIIQNMQQIKAAATAAKPSPAPVKPPRSPQPFTQTNTQSATPGVTHAKPAVPGTEPQLPVSQSTAKPGSSDDTSLIATDAQPSSIQQVIKQQLADGVKTGASASAGPHSTGAGSAEEVAQGAALGMTAGTSDGVLANHHVMLTCLVYGAALGTTAGSPHGALAHHHVMHTCLATSTSHKIHVVLATFPVWLARITSKGFQCYLPG